MTTSSFTGHGIGHRSFFINYITKESNMKKTITSLVVLGIVAAFAPEEATAGSKKQAGVPALPANVVDMPADVNPPVVVVRDTRTSPQATVGVYTGLGGFYDYQCNGGAAQHIRVNPANGNIHVIMMTADDSINFNTGRRTSYAFSTNNGVSWNNFSNLTVPSRRSGFPTLDLLQGPNAGLPGIANHNVVGADLTSVVYIDSPEGAGAFSELNTPPPLGGGDEPIWPYIAAGADGSVNMLSSRSVVATTAHYTRTTDFSTWVPYTEFPGGGDNGGFYSVASSSTGRVGYLMNKVNLGVDWLESTNSGETWPATQTVLHPPTRIAGVDTFQSWTGCDAVYSGNNAYVVLNELNVGANETTFNEQITFWSQATDFVKVANRASTPGVTAELNRAQTNHFAMGYPAIGLSGSAIVVVWMGFTTDTSAAGFNYGDIFYSVSNNNGVTWAPPVNLTNTPNLDERYPSISKWNPAGIVNITWQEDPQPGTFSVANPDNNLAARARQVYLRLTLTSAPEEAGLPNAFRLGQNFPNPFNPSTKIAYTLPVGSEVSLKVYNTLGQEVVTLVNEFRTAGTYEADFSANNLASGVYYYKLQAGRFTETKKMMLVR